MHLLAKELLLCCRWRMKGTNNGLRQRHLTITPSGTAAAAYNSFIMYTRLVPGGWHGTSPNRRQPWRS